VAVIAGAAMLVVVVAVIAFRLFTAPADRVPPGVSVGGVAVGGLSADDAVRAVRAGAVAPAGAVELDLPGEAGFPVSVPLSRLAPLPRARAAVEKALRRPSLAVRILGEVGLAPGRSVPLAFRATPARARSVADRVAAGVALPAHPASLRVTGGRIVAMPARAGRGVETVRLAALLTALPERATVPVGEVEPAVTDAQAETARARAEALVSAPVVVLCGSRPARGRST
jgi:hypothetical protein